MGSVFKNFQSDVMLYKRDTEKTLGEMMNLELETEAEIRVNEPLKFDRYRYLSGGL